MPPSLLPRRGCQEAQPQRTTLTTRPSFAKFARRRAQPRTRGVATYSIYTRTSIPRPRSISGVAPATGERGGRRKRAFHLLLAPNNCSWGKGWKDREFFFSAAVFLTSYILLGACHLGYMKNSPYSFLDVDEIRLVQSGQVNNQLSL